MAASSSTSAASKKYDIFISFRGEDTRDGFIAHLCKALDRSSIEAYTDRELNKGDEISPSLFQAIEDSNGSLVIFSKDYASSKWCLNELVKILECRKQGHFVIPVFYNVDPSDVRKQKGSYEEAFRKHEQDPRNEAMAEKWKAALTEAANIVGRDWDSQSRNHPDESELIQNIVKDVLKRLDHVYQPSKFGLVGIDRRCEQIEAMLRKYPVVGIWGIGGIGKTTIAKAVYDKLSSQYESCCFLEKIREESQRRGPNELRIDLLSELLKDSIISINPHTVIGLKHAMRRLSSKRVLIVLDDVDNSLQLEHFGQELKSLGPRSRIIIATRDKHLFTILRVKHVTYEVERLSNQESLELFRLNAFSEEYPEKGYEEITKKIVSYTQGTPLALKVLGTFLLSKTREEWESEWNKLKKIPNEEVVKVLKLSFDGLNYEDQQIFLEIACFLKGDHKVKVVSLLNSYGFHGAIGLRTLQDRALITLSDLNMVQMHDLIQEMGWQIVREESLQEPERRSRLWLPEEVIDVLKYNKGTNKVEGIILDISQIKDLHLSANTFENMINLRYLNFYYSCCEKSGKIYAPVNTQLFSHKLGYLHWDNCPLESLSSNFCAEKLVELNMSGSYIKRLWDGVQDLVNLKELDLSGSIQLIELPDFSKASRLRSVNLFNCTNLVHIHPSLLSLPRLEDLNANSCIKLRSLRSEAPLKSLKCLLLSDCLSLIEILLRSETLGYLKAPGTAIEMLHSSIGLCNYLETLILQNSFKNIPSDLSKLTSLRRLSISHCPGLNTQNLHIVLGSLPSLRRIDLEYCSNLTQLPDNIKYPFHLKFLGIKNCKRLSYITELPASIKIVWLIDCTSLGTIMTPKSVQWKLSRYSLRNCVKLDEHSLSSIMEHTCLRIEQAAGGVLRENVSIFEELNDIRIFVPKNRVPSRFRCQEAQNCVSFEIPPGSYLLGFAFYCIFSPGFYPIGGGPFLERCGCICHLENSQSVVFKRISLFVWGFAGEDIELISEHVCIWYNRESCNRLFEEMEKQKAKGQRTKKLCFEFNFEEPKIKGVDIEMVKIENAIKGCGVWPIYASEYGISINDLEPRKGFKLGYRSDDIDEQVELQFDNSRPGTSATGFTSSLFVQDQHISSQNARSNELDYSTSQMELNLELGFGKKSKRCQDMDDPQPFQRKKFKRCEDIDVSTSGVGVECFEFDHVDRYELQPFTQNIHTMNEFVFQPLPVVISVQNAWLDSTQMNTACLLDRFCEFNNSIMQLDQTRFCPDLNEMGTSGNSLDTDQQGPYLSL